MRRWLAALIVGTAVLGLAIGSAALAQTKAKPAAQPAGAFHKLSRGNQTVAASLYDAQNPGTSAHETLLEPLTLDQIAAKRLVGQGWGQIFRDMQAQGLVQEKTLRQVVTKYGRFSGSEQVAKGGSNGKLNAPGAGASSSVDGGTYGNGHGGK